MSSKVVVSGGGEESPWLIYEAVCLIPPPEYITLHKIVFRVPKITRIARTLYEIEGVIWEYSYEGKHLEKR